MRGVDGLHSERARRRDRQSDGTTVMIGNACGPCLREAIRKFESGHARLLTICEELEVMADGLPALPNNGSHLRLARRMGMVLREVHAREEAEILPVLVAALGANIGRDSVGTLVEEHRADEAAAEELAEVIIEWAAGERNHDAATLGYMLRGLFDNIRRHSDRERDQLIAPAQRRLAPD
ncbi:MAG: hemerythrin domain-containing protein [Alphaproteobacteria bacterium]|nr:hemerythrin domain-containing protein [Alphaproteobacteria bacterium]